MWSLWKNFLGIDHITADWYILCYAAKWNHEKKVISDALINHEKAYEEDPENDYNILLSLRDLLDEADIVVAHNGQGFDVPKIFARFLKHGIPPPSPFRVVDTLKVAKRTFALTSNKLDYLARYLDIGAKIDTGGIELWHGCMEGDAKSWDLMIKYNKYDVVLLSKVYNKLLPWISDHPNVNLPEADGVTRCPKCGSEHLHYRGYYSTSAGVYRRIVCNDCGGWSRERYSVLTKEQKKSVLTNAATNN